LSENTLLLATTNTGKVKEMRSFLGDLSIRIYSLKEAGIKSLYQETGQTFLENARGKSLFFSKKWTGYTLGEDSGLVVEALKGDPGKYSARYAGPEATDQENIRKLLERLQGVPAEKRKARFVSCMVLSKQGNIIHEIEKDVRGRILEKPEGHHGFGYDPVFFYPPLGKTFAQIDRREKNLVSHRGKALHALKDVLIRQHS
jgi:XTP/dITP diphosphohydrolase